MIQAYLIYVEVDRIDGLKAPYDRWNEVVVAADSDMALDSLRHITTTAPAPFGVRARVIGVKDYDSNPYKSGSRLDGFAPILEPGQPQFSTGFTESPYARHAVALLKGV